jgi:hypothetical protein
MRIAVYPLCDLPLALLSQRIIKKTRNIKNCSYYLKKNHHATITKVNRIMLFIVSQKERKCIEWAIFNVGRGTYSYRYGHGDIRWLPATCTVKQAKRAEKVGRCLLPARCLNERQLVELINDHQFHNLDYHHLTSASSVRHIKLASLKCPLTLYIQMVTYVQPV